MPRASFAWRPPGGPRAGSEISLEMKDTWYNPPIPLGVGTGLRLARGSPGRKSVTRATSLGQQRDFSEREGRIT